MSLSMNIHPISGRWSTVHITLYGPEHGSCIVINLDSQASIALHYGAEKHKEEFIMMMKEAFSKLTIGEEEKE